MSAAVVAGPRPRAAGAEEALRRLRAAAAAESEPTVERDPDGRIVAVSEAGGTWRYAYADDGALATVTDPAGAVTTYAYDEAGRLLRVGHPDGTSTRYRYDGDRLVAVDDRGCRRQVSADAAGRVRAIAYGDEVVRTFRDDAASAPRVVTRWAAGGDGRPRRVVTEVDGVAVAAGFDDDADGRLAALHLPGSDTPVAYTWDDRGRPLTVGLGALVLARFAYDDDARTVTVRLANGVEEETRADPLDGRPLRRTVRRDDVELARRDYRYDDGARVVADGARELAYDRWGRLVSAVDGDEGSWAFSYDAVGNLVDSRHPDAVGAPGRFECVGDRLVAVDGRPVSSDAQGRVTSWTGPDGTWAYRYDAAGALVQVRRDDRVVADLVNDHKGRPVRLDLRARVERHLYGLDDELLAVTDGEGRPLRLLVRTPLGVVAEVDGSLDGAWDDGRVRFLHADARGTVLAATDTAGRVVARPRVDPFGAPLDAGTAAWFGGRAFLAELGLYHLGARWYAPALRRFLTPDPWTAGPDDERIVFPLRPASEQPLVRAELTEEWLRRPRLRHRYAYCGNDPVNRVDPDGHWSVSGVLLSLLGIVWTLPNTLIGILLELSCVVGEVLRWLVWAVTRGKVSWEPLGIDTAASGRLDTFALVFRGGWLGSFSSLLGITFGNVFFVYGEWDKDPLYSGPGDVLPPAYKGKVRIPKSRQLYEHELRHVDQYSWLGPFFHVGLPLFGVYEWDVILHGYRDARLERDARDHGEGTPAPPPTPAANEVVVRRSAGGTTAPLPHAWVYWREGGRTQLLRSDAAGVLHDAASAGSVNPWDYTKDFRAAEGTAVEVAASDGARPLPAALRGTAGLLQPVTVGPGSGGRGTVDVPARRLTLQAPAELSLWPVTLTLPGDDYATAGLPQGAAAWTNPDASGNLTVPEGSPAPDPHPFRPRERALVVRGRVDAQVTALQVGLLDRGGAPVPLHDPGGSGTVDVVAAALDAPSGDTRGFRAVVDVVDVRAAFGPVQVTVVGTGAPQPVVEAFSVHLCGLQPDLVDDPAPGRAGPRTGEADEVVVVDFDRSPQSTRGALSAETRLRRMIRYPIANERRPLLAGEPPLVQPRMPLWMGEVALVGVATADLSDLLRRRHDRAVPGASSSAAPPRGTPATTTLSLRWQLQLGWDGPDSNAASVTPPLTRPHQHYAFSLSVPPTPATVTAVLHYDAAGTLTDASGTAASDPNGVLPDAFTPAPTPVPFPVAGRRAPQVRVGQRRPWGRQPGAPEHPAIVVEFQPAITDAAGNEVIRGGDGVLRVDEVRLDGTPVDPGLVVSSGGSAPAPPPAGDPLLRLPAFRVVGRNPAPAEVEEVVRALVRDHVARHAGDPHLRPLSRDCWETTVLKIFRHESGHRFRQFDDRDAGRRGFSSWVFGHEHEMPLFGPPHGYGVAQLDFFGTPARGANDDEVWSWVANVRAGIAVVLDEKARSAWALISTHVPAPIDRRTRAAYQRELVRRYNGRREMTWTGSAWAVRPPFDWADPGDHSKGPHPRLLYVNSVLGTTVVYYRSASGAPNVGDGAATQFAYPPPVPLTAADFPPETA